MRDEFLRLTPPSKTSTDRGSINYSCVCGVATYRTAVRSILFAERKRSQIYLNKNDGTSKGREYVRKANASNDLVQAGGRKLGGTQEARGGLAMLSWAESCNRIAVGSGSFFLLVLCKCAADGGADNSRMPRQTCTKKKEEEVLASQGARGTG